MSLTFDQPLWLLLALLALPFVYIALRWLHAMTRARRISVAATRTIVLLLIAAILAGASAVRTTERLAVIALVDVSQSVQMFGDADPSQPPIQQRLRAFLEQARDARRPDDMFGAVVFDGSRAAIAVPAARDTGDLTFDVSIREGTDIAEALRFASALFPPGAARRIVLASDGVETSGDALAAARQLASGPTPTPVDVLPISYSVRDEVFVEAVDAPPTAPSDATVAVRVVLRAAGPTAGTLRLLQDGAPIPLGEEGDGRRVSFGPGRRVEIVHVPLADARVHRFEAFFEPDADDTGATPSDRIASNNRAQAFTVSPGRGATLIVDGVSEAAETGAGRTLARTLQRSGIDVRVVAPAETPADLLDLQSYDLVILEDVAADELTAAQQRFLADFVSDMGGGLVMVGGPDSFGAGGWKGSPIEPILPVTLDIPERLIVPSAAIVIVLDSSGSMAWSVMGGTRSQQDIANEGAARAVLSLDKQDLVGVIEFSSMPRIVVPLGPNEDAERSAARIRAITPGGGTNLYPALDLAGAQLEGVDAAVKHVIVLSDGQSQGSAQTGFDIAQSLADRGITVSTIAVGDGADTHTLAGIADRGGGAYYRVIDPNLLPRIFLRETRIVRSPLIREGLFSPSLPPTGSPLVSGLPTPVPPLAGFVLTQTRDDPTAVYPMLGPEGEPLVAHWNVGLGAVAAFTSDAHANWAREWIGWPGYQQLWTQIARTIARPAASRSYDLAADVVGDSLRVRLDARSDEGEPLDLLSVPGVVYSPSGERLSVNLTQVGPGEYEAAVPAVETGAYVVALTPRLGDTRLPPVLGGATRAVGPELRSLRSNTALLRQIAETTGGRVLSLDEPTTASSVFDRRDLPPSRASLPIWRPLLMWLLAAVLLDIATRRIAWDRFLPREVAANLREAAARAKSQRATASTATLKAARSRIAEDATPRPAPLGPQQLDAQAELERRRRIRAAVQAQRTEPSQSAAQPAPTAEDQRGETQSSSGLLAAKRRAQRRYHDSDSGS